MGSGEWGRIPGIPLDPPMKLSTWKAFPNVQGGILATAVSDIDIRDVHDGMHDVGTVNKMILGETRHAPPNYSNWMQFLKKCGIIIC